MTVQLGVLMDSISAIHYKKDSTLALLWEAEKQGWVIHYFEQKDLFLRDGKVYAEVQLLNVFHDEQKWFALGPKQEKLLSDLDVILMRKDPPFNIEYIYTTYLLEKVEHDGVLIVNKPQSLRDANEKLFTMWFPQCCPSTLVTRSIERLRQFYHAERDIICKPLEGMGGASVFRLQHDDINASVVFEVLTQHETRFMMAQTFIPEISKGDKRIVMIDGEPVAYALARIPALGELRGNLAAGARGVAQPLTDRDRWICEQVGPLLREKGLLLVGLDVIGDFLTEINVTSPTCLRELDEQCGLNIAADVLKAIKKKL